MKQSGTTSAPRLWCSLMSALAAVSLMAGASAGPSVIAFGTEFPVTEDTATEEVLFILYADSLSHVIDVWDVWGVEISPEAVEEAFDEIVADPQELIQRNESSISAFSMIVAQPASAEAAYDLYLAPMHHAYITSAEVADRKARWQLMAETLASDEVFAQRFLDTVVAQTPVDLEGLIAARTPHLEAELQLEHLRALMVPMDSAFLAEADDLFLQATGQPASRFSQSTLDTIYTGLQGIGFNNIVYQTALDNATASPEAEHFLSAVQAMIVTGEEYLTWIRDNL